MESRKTMFYKEGQTSIDLTESKKGFIELVDLTKKLLFEMKEMDEQITFDPRKILQE